MNLCYNKVQSGRYVLLTFILLPELGIHMAYLPLRIILKYIMCESDLDLSLNKVLSGQYILFNIIVESIQDQVDYLEVLFALYSIYFIGMNN